jgi:hypothetical protein
MLQKKIHTHFCCRLAPGIHLARDFEICSVSICVWRLVLPPVADCMLLEALYRRLATVLHPQVFGSPRRIHSFIHAVCLTTGPQPPSSRVLHRMRSSASSIHLQYPIFWLRSSSSCSSLSFCNFYPSLSPSFSNLFQKAVSMQDVTHPVSPSSFYCL